MNIDYWFTGGRGGCGWSWWSFWYPFPPGPVWPLIPFAFWIVIPPLETPPEEARE